MDYNEKYSKYKNKYVKLKNTVCDDIMVGGTKFKIITDSPKLKYVKYTGNNNIHIINTIDNDEINEFSEFMIGSITKLFTGMLIIILNDKKMLDVNDNINKYIKPNKHNNFSNVIINDLLMHTSGIIWYLTYKDIPNKYKTVNTSTEALDIFMKYPLFTGEKGIKKYSSMAFIMLGAIIEKVTNMSYVDALKHYILKPCKMNNTNIGEPNIKIYNNHIHQKDSDVKEEIMEKYMVNSAGGLYSCVADLLNFAKNIPNILTPSQIKRCYGFYKDKNEITHGGFIYAGAAQFKVEYTSDWKIKNILIEMNTWTEYDY